MGKKKRRDTTDWVRDKDISDKERKRILANIEARNRELNSQYPNRAPDDYHEKLVDGFGMLKGNYDGQSDDDHYQGNEPPIDPDDVPLMDRIHRQRNEDEFYLDDPDDYDGHD